MTTADMDKAIEARGIWKELYSGTGFISAEGRSGIHLTEEEFLETFAGADITERPRNSAEKPFEYSAEYKGERFFCIGQKWEASRMIAKRLEADDEKDN